MSNVIQIKKPEGIYSILYGMHIRSQDPHDLPEDTGAVVLETGTFSYLKDPLKAVKDLKEHIQYKELFTYLEQKRIPLIFSDVKYKVNDFALLMVDNGATALQWVQGYKLLKSKKKNPDIFSRLLISGWLMLPFIANSLRLISVITNKGLKQTAALKKLSHKLHPEADFIYLTIRNALIAEKNTFIMNHISKKKHITTVIGGGHVGIEDMQSMDEEKRLANIKSLAPILKRIVNPEYVYKAVEYVYDGKEWQVKKIIEVPSLEHILSGNTPKLGLSA